jgi:tRNA G10  N-methylase Trm11
MKLSFILGNQPELSKQEIEAVAGVEAERTSKEVAIAEVHGDSADYLMRTLGGTKKIGTVIAELNSIDEQELAEMLGNMLFGRSESKVLFGLSAYDGGNTELADHLKGMLTKLGMTIKTHCKSLGLSTRLVTSRNTDLSPADIQKNQLLKKGAEFQLIATEHGVILAETLAVQPLEEWAERDMEKPVRDRKRGMLPPKLARMMLNIAGKRVHEAVVLDPFCGMGTVLIEALELGSMHVIASDIDKKATRATRENLLWYKADLDNEPAIDVYTCAAANLGVHLSEGSVDLIVTEPYLGPLRTKEETRSELESIQAELTQLFTASLAALEKILTRGGRIVFIFPVRNLQDKQIPVDMNAIMKNNSLTILSETLYHQPNQSISRNIVVMEKSI